MSECVVRMKMPKSCPCDFSDMSSPIFIPCFAYDGIPSRREEFVECVRQRKRPSWCPIVCQLPEGHGRLVDADALKENRWDADTRCGYVQVVDVGEIDNAPTIVPAERSET